MAKAEHRVAKVMQSAVWQRLSKVQFGRGMAKHSYVMFGKGKATILLKIKKELKQ